MLTVLVIAAPAGPATARVKTAASARISLRIVRTCLSEVRLPVVVPGGVEPDARSASVLLITSMPLRTPHRRALVAGGTGRVGTAIVERLRAEGWTVVSAGRAEGDLRTKA